MILDQSQVSYNGFEGILNIINLIKTNKDKHIVFTRAKLLMRTKTAQKGSVTHISYTGGNKNKLKSKKNVHNAREIFFCKKLNLNT